MTPALARPSWHQSLFYVLPCTLIKVLSNELQRVQAWLRSSGITFSMRRAVNGSSLKRLLAAGAQAIEASAVTWKTAVNEAQVHALCWRTLESPRHVC